MKGSDSVFDCVHLLYDRCQKINPSWGGSYLDSPNWIKNKTATINPINKNYKWFQYAVEVAQKHIETKKITKNAENWAFYK